MAVYSVTYDLKTPGKNYTELLTALRALDSNHAQQSLWFVNTTMAEVDLLNHLTAHIDSNDWMFVAFLTNRWASIRMPTTAAWLHARGL
jgi:hypothetical protein